MTACLGFPTSNPTSSLREGEAHYRVQSSERKARDSRITAFALTIIAIIFIAIAFALFGMATLSPELTMGLGIFPYLAGTFLGAVGIGIFIGALAHFAIGSVRDCQKQEWEQQLPLPIPLPS